MTERRMTRGQIKKLLLKAREYNQKSTDIVNQLFEYADSQSVDLREINTESYNANCLADTITCYVAYDEYDVDKVTDEIISALKNK